MKGYHVVFDKVNSAVLKEFEVRQPKKDEAVVKVNYTLISAGTEKATLSGAPNVPYKFPSVPGYSSVGIVTEVGAEVKTLSVGDRVFVSHGGHASYNVKRAAEIIRIPDTVKDIDAVFCKLASFPMHGLRNCRFEMGESVVIVGLGNLGLLGVQLAKIAGALPVIGIGNREIRRELALKFGADYVFAPDDPLLGKKVTECAQMTGNGADVVIDTSGSVDALIAAVEYTAKYGRISLVGCNRVTDKPIDLYRYHRKGISIIGSNASTQRNFESSPGVWTGRKNFKTILSYMAQGKLTPSLFQPVIISPEQTKEIYHRLLTDREFPLGVVFDWTQY